MTPQLRKLRANPCRSVPSRPSSFPSSCDAAAWAAFRARDLIDFTRRCIRRKRDSADRCGSTGLRATSILLQESVYLRAVLKLVRSNPRLDRTDRPGRVVLRIGRTRTCTHPSSSHFAVCHSSAGCVYCLRSPGVRSTPAVLVCSVIVLNTGVPGGSGTRAQSAFGQRSAQVGYKRDAGSRPRICL